MKRQVARSLATDYPVEWLCDLLGLPRSSYYHARSGAGDEGSLRAAVGEVAGAWPTYGYRRVTAMLRRAGWAVNAKRVRRVMRDLGLAAAPPRRRVRTTDSGHPFPRFPNRVAGLTVDHPDHVWVAEIV
jgi:transposase InsO family protein